MNIPTWVKVTAVSLTALSFAAGITKAALDGNARQELAKQLAECSTPETMNKVLSHVPNTAAVQRFEDDMDIHSALLFYCGPKISSKIAGFKSADGHELIQEKDGYFIVWQEDLKRADTLHSILKAHDPITKTQICVTFDKQNKDLVVHLGGTDFSSGYDLLCAGTSALGGLSPRSVDGAVYADSIVKLMKARYPEIAAGDVNLSIVAHSQGGTAVPGMTMALAKEGFMLNKTVLLDPFGAHVAYSRAAEFMNMPMESLTNNVVTVKPDHPGILDKFKKASKPVGKKEASTAKGHLGKNFVEAYNQQRAQHGKTGNKLSQIPKKLPERNR